MEYVTQLARQNMNINGNSAYRKKLTYNPLSFQRMLADFCSFVSPKKISIKLEWRSFTHCCQCAHQRRLPGAVAELTSSVGLAL
jgi:hypothetical protein